MNLAKTYIRVPGFKGKTSVQLTLDNDFNVPDMKPDIDRLIQEKGDIHITEVKPMKGKLLIRGELAFGTLYMGEGNMGPLYAMDGSIPFEEMVNMDGLEEMDMVRVLWDMEDLRTGVINSRKISVRSIVVLHITALRMNEIEAAVAMDDREGLWGQNQVFAVSPVAVSKKDQLRIRDEAGIPSNRPNMMEILWHQENLENLEIRLIDGAVGIRGELNIFMLYVDETLENPVNDVELSVPVDGTIDISDVTQEMIPNIQIHMDHLNLEIRNDKDGEARVVGVEAVLAADMVIYKEEQIELLKDIYSPKVTLTPQVQQVAFENVIMKNQSKCPVRERVKLREDSGKMLQICNARGTVKLDSAEMTEGGIAVEGVVYLRMLYISDDDRRPVNASKAAIPFSYTVETGDTGKACSYEVYPSIEQMNVSMIGGNELEAKMIISLDAMIFEEAPAEIISDVIEEPLDFDKIENMPNMVGYIVKDGDTIWKLAKRYYASPEDIREVNGLDNDNLSPGTPLLIMKNMEILK